MADGVGLGRRAGDALGDTDGSSVGELEEAAIGTTATAEGAAAGATSLGPGGDQPPSGKAEQPTQTATNRINADSRRSGRMAARDRMRDSFGIAALSASRHEFGSTALSDESDCVGKYESGTDSCRPSIEAVTDRVDSQWPVCLRRGPWPRY
jgi:hypothetical protein